METPIFLVAEFACNLPNKGQYGIARTPDGKLACLLIKATNGFFACDFATKAFVEVEEDYYEELKTNKFVEVVYDWEFNP